MGRSQHPRGALLTQNLPQLQNLIKRDPEAYKEEFLQQWVHYESIRRIFQLNPSEQSEQFRETVTFIAQVSQCYPKETADFPNQISTLLLEHYASLDPDTRKTLVSNLVLLRNRDVITCVQLLQTLFPLLPQTTSSTLRSFVRKTILSEIYNANSKTKNHKVNKAVQAMLFRIIERGLDGEVIGDKGKGKMGAGPTTDAASDGRGEAMWAVLLTKELWKKGVWNDAKPVSIIALGCFHRHVKVQSAAIHFFLGVDDEEDSDDEEEEVDVRGLKHRHQVTKKTRSGEKKLIKELKSAKRKRANNKKKAQIVNFPAIQMLNDPQSFGERLYDALLKYDKRLTLEHKVLMMQLLSRVMGSHKLCVLGFYSYVMKYLTHHQLRVPSILVALAQSVHDLTPPDDLTPVVRKLAQEFVHPGVGTEVITAGLNTIREICRNQPHCMEEDLLGDLIQYRKSKDKGVMAASRGLLQLFRETNPAMLKRRERGKEANTSSKAVVLAPFGHTAEAAMDIDGINLLESHLKKAAEENGVDEEDEAAWNEWEVASESSDSSSDGWISVSSDGEEFEMSDSDDEEDKKTAKTAQPDGEDVTMAEADAADETATGPSLATTKILTPADFALLNELKVKAATDASKAGGKKRKLTAAAQAESQKRSGDAVVSEADILGPRKKAKADYEERMASIAKGREGREKFGSNKGKKNKEMPSSTTNREKARNKPIMMLLASGAVKGKKKASLRDKQRRLRMHIEKAKKQK